MDCFFHNAVPSIAPCRGCRKPVCATCRNENGDCPGCVLAARVEAARRSTMIHGGVGPSYGTYQEPQAAYSAPPSPEPPPPGPPKVRRAAAVAVRPETRAVVALGYPFWPLAVVALLDGKASLFVKRQAWQALGFNLAMWGLVPALLGAASAIPILGFGAWAMLPFLGTITIVASVVYAFKVWQGDDVDVPLVSDWVDARLPAGAPQQQS